MNKGLIHIYCGDGKGKTTAAVGLAVRCAGAGGRVLFFQFLKGNTSGEIKALSGIAEIDVISGIDNMKFVWKMTDSEREKAREDYIRIFSDIQKRASEYDLVILDEIIPALKYNFIKENELIRFMESKPDKVELVLTGRDPSDELLSAADYVTEMKKIKHPYDIGIAARRKIEF